MGCQRVALGHHNDDVLETFLLSLLYEGRINCFSPVTYLDRTDLYSIRPMIYVKEGDIKGVTKRLELPVVKSNCPVDGHTKRAEVKNILADLDKTVNAGLKKRMFTAIQTSGVDGWKKESNSPKK
jgi:tRNA(Ile)-lysidine synthase TilS/MesJ